MKTNHERGSLQRLRQSAGYWTELAIAEFTEGLRRVMGDMKQKDLAEAMGVTEAYVSTVLRGDENFTIQQMNKIAHHLDAAVHIHVAKRDQIVRWLENSEPRNRTDTTHRFQPQESRTLFTNGNPGFGSDVESDATTTVIAGNG